jgi:hypothetical protein
MGWGGNSIDAGCVSDAEARRRREKRGEKSSKAKPENAETAEKRGLAPSRSSLEHGAEIPKAHGLVREGKGTVLSHLTGGA